MNGVGGTWPAALLPGQPACLLARGFEVRAWMRMADPASAPRGSPRPRSGERAACFTALDPLCRSWGPLFKCRGIIGRSVAFGCFSGTAPRSRRPFSDDGLLSRRVSALAAVSHEVTGKEDITVICVPSIPLACSNRFQICCLIEAN